jgi:hypothetical protein
MFSVQFLNTGGSRFSVLVIGPERDAECGFWTERDMREEASPLIYDEAQKAFTTSMTLPPGRCFFKTVISGAWLLVPGHHYFADRAFVFVGLLFCCTRTS